MPDDPPSAQRDALTLLRALRSDAPAPAASTERVYGRLVVTLGSGALGAASGVRIHDAPDAHSDVEHAGSDVHANGARAANAGASDGIERGTLGAPSSYEAAVPRAPSALETVAISKLTSGPTLLTGMKLWAWGVGLTLAGGAAGGALHAAWTPEKVRIVYVERPSVERPTRPDPAANQANAGAASLAGPTGAPGASTADPAPSSETTRAASEVASASRGPSGSSVWAKERAVLDAARRALAQGEPAACLAQIERHARAFPDGKLVEEREALAINALVAVGRYADARKKADTFARRYPQSFLAPSVHAAVASIP